MAGAYWRVTIFGNGAGSGTQTVWHFLKNEQVEEPSIVCDLVHTNALSFFNSRLHGNGFFYTGIKAELKDSNEEKTHLKGVNIQGTQSSALLPMQLAVVWNLQGVGAANKQAGMVYIPGLAGSANTGGLLSSVGETQHLSCISQMMTKFGGGAGSVGLRWAIRSRKLDSLYPVSAVSLSTAFGTLKNRRRGKGF